MLTVEVISEPQAGRTALALFIITTAIGLVNGQRTAMIDPSRTSSTATTSLTAGTARGPHLVVDVLRRTARCHHGDRGRVRRCPARLCGMAYFARNLEPPRALFIAVAHTEFVGMMTNAIFATILLATMARRAQHWSWADSLIFWGMNIGWTGFALVELLGASDLVRLFTPIMGLSLSLAIATYWMRLGGMSEQRPA